MVSAFLYSLLSLYLVFRMRPRSQSLDIVVNGLIPSKPNAENTKERGTKVLLYFGPPRGTVAPGSVIDEGYADEDGEFKAKLDRSRMNEPISCRTIHPSYKIRDDPISITPYGAFHTPEMTLDHGYIGKHPGTEIGNIRRHYLQSVKRSDASKAAALQRLRQAGMRLSEIPFLFWLIWYFAGVLSFGTDYWLLGTHFQREIENFGDAAYLSVVTVTTLGYGEIVPVSTITKFLVSIQALSGVVLIGLSINSLFAGRQKD